MQKSNNIIDELRGISEVVANLAVDQPFIVPEGYFDQFPQQMLTLLKGDQDEHTPSFAGDNKTGDPYSVPGDYFENLAGNILNRVQASSAEETPEYISPVLSKINKQLPFSLPEGYFDDMPANVVAGIQAIEFVESTLEIVSPQLLELKQRTVYTVPEGYFESFPKQVLDKVKPQGKVIKANFRKQVIRLAAAAMLTGVIVTGIFLFSQKENGNAGSFATNASFDSSLNQISDADIRAYVEANSMVLADPANVAAADLKQEDMKDMLAEVSDKDIESYLLEYGILKEELKN